MSKVRRRSGKKMKMMGLKAIFWRLSFWRGKFDVEKLQGTLASHVDLLLSLVYSRNVFIRLMEE
jgi:hypothetical protein